MPLKTEKSLRCQFVAALMTAGVAVLVPTMPAMAGTASGSAAQKTFPVPKQSPATDSAEAKPDREFTPLDEIDRVRKSSCGLEDFGEFLGWYVSSTETGGWLEQVVWTNYMVKVGKLDDPNASPNWIDRQRYLGQFRIYSIDYQVSRNTQNDVVNPQVRKVTLRRLSPTRYRVDWRGGLPYAGVEGADQAKQAGAYIFDHIKDCWYLTEDLR